MTLDDLLRLAPLFNLLIPGTLWFVWRVWRILRQWEKLLTMPATVAQHGQRISRLEREALRRQWDIPEATQINGGAT